MQCIIPAKANYLKACPMQGRGFEMRNRLLSIFLGS